MNTEVLLNEYRGGVLECQHYGAICITSKDGVIAQTGDSDWDCFYRSASKPLQSLPVFIHGLDQKHGITEEEAAIFSGSHWGDEDHVRVLESLLEKTGLSEDQMIMLPTYPNREEQKRLLLRTNQPPRKIYHNCSGKHVGMMLLARELGESVENYWTQESLTQREILHVIAQMTDIDVEQIRIGVDGCGVPVYATPFHTIATSFLRLAQPQLIGNPTLRGAVEKNIRILHRYPDMIAGKDVICSILTSDPDLIAKGGALGVYAVGIRSLGVGIAVKIADGSQEEYAAIILEVFRQLGYNSPVLGHLKKMYPSVIINDNKEEVGYSKTVFQLQFKEK